MSINPARYRPPESSGMENYCETTQRMSKAALARRIFDNLKKAGVIGEGVTYDMARTAILDSIGDRDNDKFYDLDTRKLFENLRSPGFVSETFAGEGDVLPEMIASFLQLEVKGITQYVPNGPGRRRTAPPDGPNSSPYGERETSSAVDRSQLIARRSAFDLSSVAQTARHFPANALTWIHEGAHFRTLGDEAKRLQRTYNAGGMGAFNLKLEKYLTANYVHLVSPEGTAGGDPYAWGMATAGMSPETSASDFSQARAGGVYKGRIVCNNYAWLAATIMDQMVDPKTGENIFDWQVVVLGPTGTNGQGAPVAHAVLVYRVKAEGGEARTFVLSNNQVWEVPQGMDVGRFLKEKYPTAREFEFYNDMDTYQKRYTI